MFLQCALGAIMWVCLLLTPGVNSDCPCEDPSLCKPISNTPKKELFIFSLSDSPDNWNKYNWSQITTVVKVGNVSSELMCLAHKHGARIVLLVGYGPPKNLANYTLRQMWREKQLRIVQQYHYDGLNFDIESVILPDQKAYRDGYTALVRETAATLRFYNPYAQISADVARAPNAADRFYDYVGLATACDFLFLMDYDEWGGEPLAWANSPYHYTLEGILSFLKLPNVTGSKLVMGVPWYGYDYPCRKIYPHNTCITLDFPGRQVNKLESLPTRLYNIGHGVDQIGNSGIQVGYSAIMTLLNISTMGRLWDESSQSPFFNYLNQHDKLTHQVWYDDRQSLMIKLELVNSLGLRGAGMWHADCLDYSDTPQGQQQRSDMWGAFSIISR